MIFIDSGAFLARYHRADQYHLEAVEKWRLLADGTLRAFTSNLVVLETVELLARRLSYTFAAERARHIFSTEEVTILRPDAEDERAAISVFEKYADSRISFTDSVSCILMRRNRLKRVFGFDRHFTRMGFEFF